jgi:hypothetical protein
MPEPGSDRGTAAKLRFRPAFTGEALSSDALEAAQRLFARWMARGFAPSGPRELDSPLGRAADPGTESADGPASGRHASHTGPTLPPAGLRFPLTVAEPQAMNAPQAEEERTSVTVAAPRAEGCEA